MATYIVIAAVVCLVATLIASNDEEARLVRALRAAPASSVAALREGAPARLTGTVVADATLSAPLTGRPCVAYRVVVEEKRKSWRTLVVETRGVPFTLDDGTGRAIVDLGASKLVLEMDATTRSGTLDDATAAEAAFLARHGMTATGYFFNKTLRYTEGVIEAGERVAVLGQGVREPDPDGARGVTGYRDALPTRVRIGGSADHPIIVTDRGHLTAAR